MPRSMEGTLMSYDDAGHFAFVSGCRDWANVSSLVIFVGGLTDSLLSKDYIPLLASRLPPTAAFAQPELTSARFGYGLTCLDQDIDELSAFISHIVSLRAAAGNAPKEGDRWIHIIGHSTGCQDCVRFLARSPHAPATAAVALQGPVSDREFLASFFSTSPPQTGMLSYPDAGAVDPRLWPCDGNAPLRAHLEHALALATSGRGQERMPPTADANAAITADRFASFAGCGGDDDMFSTDFSREERVRALGPLAAAAGTGAGESGVRVLMLMSLADEYLATPLSSAAVAHQFALALGAAPGVACSAEDTPRVDPRPLQPEPRVGELPALLDKAANLVIFARTPATAPAAGVGGVVVAGITGADHACSTPEAAATAADTLLKHFANEL